MSYDSKIAQVNTLVDTHNSNVDDSAKVNFEEFMENLRKLGGTSEQTLKSVSWEDLQTCGLPVILARTASKIFRQEADGNGEKSGWVSPKKVHQMSYKELLERYDPKDVKSSVAKRLQELSDGKKFIVFNDNGKVNIEESVKLLEDLLTGLEEVETAFVCGRPFPTFKIGERLEAYAEENPLYHGRTLRSDEVCDQTGRSWKGVAIEIRQLLYLAVNFRELRIETVADAGDVMDKVMSQGTTLDSLRSRYPNASKEFDRLSKIGQLPLLKVRLGDSSSKRNSPFGKNTTF